MRDGILPKIGQTIHEVGDEAHTTVVSLLLIRADVSRQGRVKEDGVGVEDARSNARRQ